MKWILVPALLILNGCAYTVANTGTFAATGKSLTDHTLSQTTQADCNITNVPNGKYYCEQRDIGVTYNRNPF